MEDDVSKIKEAIDLVQFFGEYTKLQKTGKNYKGICPLHHEKTPSFFVRPDRGMWYCFGCQKGGDIFNFLIEKEHVSFGEALQLLVKRAGIKLSGRYDAKASETKEQLLKILSLANEFYVQQLQAKNGIVARNYIQNRGLESAIVEQFSLGFAPDSWDVTYSYLEKKGIHPRDIVAAGLAIEKDHSNRIYDRFRNRLMFPVKDHLGRIVGFSARLLSGEKEAKYVNTPETAVFKKGKLLYGYTQADDIAREKGYMIMVEGNIDVLSLVQAGIKNVVAPLGTGLSSDQLHLLQRIAPRLLLAFDADEAGQKATDRAILEASKEGFEVKVASITGAKDPDEAIRADRKRFITDMQHAKPAFDFIIQKIQKQFDSNSAYGRKKIAEVVFAFISAQPDLVVQERYMDQLAAELGTRAAAIRQDFQQWLKNNKQADIEQEDAKKIPATMPASTEKKNKQQRVEDYFLALLFNVPDSIFSHPNMQNVIASLKEDAFTQSLHQRIIASLLSQQDSYSLEELTRSIQSEDQAIIDSLVMRDFGSILESETVALKELQRVHYEILQMYYRRMLKSLARKKQRDTLEEETQQEINVTMQEITRTLREIETAL